MRTTARCHDTVNTAFGVPTPPRGRLEWIEARVGIPVLNACPDAENPAVTRILSTAPDQCKCTSEHTEHMIGDKPDA
jgi:hypothetical protein